MWQNKNKQCNHTRLSTVRNLVHIHESRVAAGSKMKVCLGPSSASTAIWWCHTVRIQVGLLEPLPSLTSPKRYQVYGRHGFDHRITHLHRSFQLELRGCGGGCLHPPSPGSRSRPAGSASRHPRCPPWPPRAQPLGNCWKGHGSLTGIPR